MSSVSQGPGWWQASDGKWYSPEQSTSYDFDDGEGPVAAHRHPNGGGWVADSATVAESAFVGPIRRCLRCSPCARLRHGNRYRLGSRCGSRERTRPHQWRRTGGG